MPEPVGSHDDLSEVRFSMVKPWALGWMRRKSFHLASESRRVTDWALSLARLGRGCPASWAA